MCSVKRPVCNFIKKETLAQVFSCEFCEISNNTFSTEHLKTTVSYKKCVCFETLTITYYLQKGNTSEKANKTMYSRFIT